MPKTLYLLDGHALAYRTFFALTGGGRTTSRWTTTKGEPTAGIYGFTSVLLRYLDQDRPDYLAVAFDVGKTFRDELFEEYKATREKMPDDLRVQIQRIRELLSSFNIPILEREGFEADDVLGSAARIAAEQGVGVKIITGDRDLLQLVDQRIIVALPEGRSLSEAKDFTPEEVVASMGIRPDQVVDYKALVGDKSDNIPGITGIGDKTATSLLQKYGTFENIYSHLDEIGGSVAKKLTDQREQAELSRKLAKIVTNLDIHLDLEKARVENFEPKSVEALFRELEFRSLMKRLVALYESFGMSVKADPVAIQGKQLALFGEEVEGVAEIKEEADPYSGPILFEVIDTPEALEALEKVLREAEIIAFDTETTSTEQMEAELVGISLSVSPGQGYYIPVGHRSDDSPQLPLRRVIEAVQKPLRDPKIHKAGHNLKYDYVLLARQGLRVHPLDFDTMIAEWLRDPNSRNLGLKNLAWVRLGTKMTEIEDLIGRGRDQITMAEVPIMKAAAYAALDAEVVLRLMPQLREDLEGRNVFELFRNIEMPLIKVLAEMEMEGIGLDTPFLAEMSQQLEGQMAEIEQKVYGSVGESFNLNSTQQLSEALFEKLALTPPDRTRKTASGHYSTAASVLEAMRKDHQVVDWVLQYRELSKLKSTYVDALQEQVNPETGRVHTSYNQTGSVTGRIASSNPNLQNIPIRTALGREIRRAFVAAPGYRLMSVDYSQVELRLVAHMADDQAMIETFRAGQDIHATTAAAIYGIPLDQVTKAQRRHAKAVNFGLIYGMSPYGLTRSTDLTLAEAEDFVEAYFHKFPGVKRYLDNMRKLAAKKGYVETLLGRRRYFPRLQGQTNRNIRNREEREAINAPIQGTAADIIKIAMLNVAKAIKTSDLKTRMLLQVHDELVFECRQSEERETAKKVQELMENAYELKVPLITEVRSGPNWNEMSLVEV